MATFSADDGTSLAYHRAGAGMFGTRSGGLPFSYFSGGLGL